MYNVCGAIAKAENEKVLADLETEREAKEETQEDLKKEADSRKEAEKKVKASEAEISEIKEAKEKADTENKKIAKDVEKTGADLTKAKKEADKLKSDIEKEKEAAAEAMAELQEAKDRAEKAEADLAAEVARAEALQAEAEDVKARASIKVAELEKEQEAVLANQVVKGKRGSTVEATGEPQVPTWSTGLMKCCAKPGGVGLCVKGFLCPCLILGKMNASLKLDGSAPCPGGCPGGCCLGCVCAPCYMCKAAPIIAQSAGRDEKKFKACLCAACCPCCYITQVQRELLIVKDGGGETSPKAEAPLQETMGEGGEGGDEAMGAKKSSTVVAAEPGASKWSTGLLKCCSQPGGVGLCVKSMCCPCLITGKLNGYLQEQGSPGCAGGCKGGCCLGCCCMPCFMRKAGPAVASLAGKEEGKCRACMCGVCCPCCYLGQVYRESLILTEG